MRSMTGYGQGAAESSRVRVSVALRGFNHRYLDLVWKLRDDLRDSEPFLRELFTAVLYRGRVEAAVEVEMLSESPVEVVVDERLIDEIQALEGKLSERGVVRGELTFGELVRLPEVVRFRPKKTVWDDDDRDVLRQAAEAALAQLVKAREVEGEKLSAILRARLDALAQIVARLEERRAAAVGETLEALRRRITELLDGEPAGERLDDDRLAQEAAILIDKSDVAEELDRLVTHGEHFRAIMGRPGSVGKRLDFLAQEILRELNTVGAKCRDGEMTRDLLEGKSICEQIREQVQNVE